MTNVKSFLIFVLIYLKNEKLLQIMLQLFDEFLFAISMKALL